MKIRIEKPELFRSELRARMEFRYGMARMTHLPHLFLRLQVVADGGRTTGLTADHLPPKWFTKDPARSPEEEIEEMLRVVLHAVQEAVEIEAESPFAFWRELYRRQAAWAEDQNLPPLLGHFGTALVEKALIDGFCRSRRTSFARALRENLFGIDLGAVHGGLAGSSPAEWLPPVPLPSVLVRHTVGLGDPLREEDIPAAGRLEDGLPQSLESATSRYHLRHFKVKVSGVVQEDLARVAEVFRLLENVSGSAWSLDGNEGYRDPDQFYSFVERLTAEPSLRGLLDRLLFIEQPFHREIALSSGVGDVLRRLPRRLPVIIDESDAEIGSLPRALEIGYAGTSHKNCKGIFKGIANACLLARRRRVEPDRVFIMSGEDLTNVAPLALQQDLAVQAALGNESVERNGQHFFRGLSHLPPGMQEEVAAAHADLFEPLPGGGFTLRIEEGRISLGSVNSAPFGTGLQPDVGRHFNRFQTC